MAKKAKVKRDRSPGYNERQRLMQRARDDKRRLEKLEVAKLEAKQDRDPRGVDCSPASPLTEKEKEKKATGRPRKAQKLSLTGARGSRTKRALSLSRALSLMFLVRSLLRVSWPPFQEPPELPAEPRRATGLRQHRASPGGQAPKRWAPGVRHNPR
eukprot:COSAG03_NODE_849_length_5637_cov_3.297941_3_plen_156_part_00